jgi:hypothetical protein
MPSVPRVLQIPDARKEGPRHKREGIEGVRTLYRQTRIHPLPALTCSVYPCIQPQAAPPIARARASNPKQPRAIHCDSCKLADESATRMAPESDASRGAREDTYVEELGVGESVPVTYRR